jgi:DNA polymerase III subunit epsilon
VEEDYTPDYAADRAATIAWARAALADPRTRILGSETTGLGPRAEMVELAILDPAGGICYCSGFCPQGPCEPGAARVHGLTPAQLAILPAFPGEFPAIVAALYGTHVLSYNAAFDARLLAQTCRAWDLPTPPEADWECLMERYAAFVGQWDDYHGNYRWQRLEEASWVFGEGTPPNHTALGDARAALAVLRQMAEAE